MAISRKNLKPEQAYYDQKDDMYFWTPDGEGGYWYATKEEMEEQHGEGTVISVSEILPW
jgi:hypothetical protein